MGLARFIPKMQLPLLRKEMVEVAVRRRTYIIRFIYAVAMFFVWGLVLWEMYTDTSGDAGSMLGQGKELFTAAMVIQLVSIFLFLPASVAGSITTERENKTMVLLLVTDLRPWEILTQKLVGRLLPVLTFLFLAMPLAGVAYLFGGVTLNQVAISVYVLILTALQIGAAVVFVSTFCKTTVSSLLVSYLVGPLIYLMAIIGNIVIGVLWVGVIYMGAAALNINIDFEASLMMNAFPPSLLFAFDTQTLGHTVLFTVPVLLVSGLFVLMARDELVSGTLAMGPQAPVSMQFTQTRTTPSAYKRPLPTDEPVSWRLTLGGAGSKTSVRVATLSALVIIVGFFAMSLMGGNVRGSLGLLGFMGCLTWAVATLVLVVLAAGLFATERTKGTLDVLLATPMSSREILTQKMNLVHRWWIAMVTVLGTLLCLRALCLLADGEPLLLVADAILVGACIAIYSRLFIWFSIWLGLTVTTHAKATLMAISIVAGWCAATLAVPIFFVELFDIYDARFVTMFSPLSVIVASEWPHEVLGDWDDAEVITTIVQLCAYGGALLWLRRHVLRHLDTYLGRTEAGLTAPGRPIESPAPESPESPESPDAA